MRLSRRFFRLDAVSLARALLGQVLVRVLDDGTRIEGRIVETEAYLGPADRAAHSYAGRRTVRNQSMYLDAGHAYVYFTYGMHWCMNIVSDGPDIPTACLLRALEPIRGLEAMRQNRAAKIPAHRLRETDYCSGPAKLTQAMAINRDLDGEDLTRSHRLYVRRGLTLPASQIVSSPRIGVAYAGRWADEPLRFFIRGQPHVSTP